MADKLMRAQVSIPLDSALPADSIVNTFYFDGDDSNEPDAAYHSIVLTKLTQFYQAIDGVIFPQTVGPLATVKIYDMRDPEPRVPEHTNTIALVPTFVDPMPNEVALCLSFQADVVSGQNQARRRGRVFLGPLKGENDILDSQARPTAAVRTAIANAASTLASPSPLPVAIGSVSWAIYSPTTDITSSIDDAFHDVQSGWIDNAFDTQRRRGAQPTQRTTWT